MSMPTMSMPSGPAADEVASNLFGAKGGGGLEPFFAPQNIAVIGATERPGSIGRMIVWSLLGSPFGGTIAPVNPHRPHVLGVRAYPTVRAVPDPIDLAVLVTPAPT